MKNGTLIGVALAGVVILGAGYMLWPVADKNDKDSASLTDVSQMPVTSGENPEPGSTVHDLPVEPAAAAARAHLARELSIANEKSIVIMMVEERTWSDGCLGLPKEGEFCTQALVEGFRVEMLAQGKTYVYRTNKDGSALRAE